MRIFLIGMIISLNVFAAQWADLEEGTTYTLGQTFQLPQLGERSVSSLDFMKGEKFTLKEIMPLPIGFPVTAFIFNYNNCPGSSLKTDLELVTVEGNGVIVGAAMEECELSVYVEGQDYYTNSLFE